MKTTNRMLASLFMLLFSNVIIYAQSAIFNTNPLKEYKINGVAQVVYMTYSPDGKFIAAATTDNSIVIWNAESKTIVRTLKGHEGLVNTFAYSPDGNYLVSGSNDKKIFVWDTKNGIVKNKLEGHEGEVYSVDVDAQSRYIASASADKSLRIWSLESGNIEQVINDHAKGVTAVKFNPQGNQLISASLDQTVKIWTLEDTWIPTTTITKVHSKWIRAIAYSPDNKYFATTGDDQQIKVWKAGTDSLAITLKGHKNWVRTLNYSPDGKYLVSGDDNKNTKIWETSTGKLVAESTKNTNIITSAAFSPDGKYVAIADFTNSIKLYDAAALQITPIEKPIFAANKGKSKTNQAVSSEEGMDIDIDPTALPTNHLLVIAINDYKYWPDLANAQKDADEVVKTLTSFYTFEPQNVYKIYGNQATAVNIMAKLKELKDKLSGNDNLLVYFSGHGSLDDIGKGSWVPYDAKEKSDHEYLANSRLLEYIEVINTKHTFVVADACFSGSILIKSRGIERAQVAEKSKSRTAFTSGGIQKVSDGKAGENSPFAHYFINYLKNYNEEPMFTASDLIHYVTERVLERTKAKQEPKAGSLPIDGHDGGDFVFYKKK